MGEAGHSETHAAVSRPCEDFSPPALSQETTAVAVPDVADAAYSNNREAM